MRYGLLVGLLMLLAPVVRAQQHNMDDFAWLEVRELAYVFYRCGLERTVPVAAPDTLRKLLGTTARVLRWDWSCKGSMRGLGFRRIDVRVYTSLGGKVYCSYAYDGNYEQKVSNHVLGCDPFIKSGGH